MPNPAKPSPGPSAPKPSAAAPGAPATAPKPPAAGGASKRKLSSLATAQFSSQFEAFIAPNPAGSTPSGGPSPPGPSLLAAQGHFGGAPAGGGGGGGGGGDPFSPLVPPGEALNYDGVLLSGKRGGAAAGLKQSSLGGAVGAEHG
eukprot:CAMPEP_0184726770 /NCGR_PEP_ID=MMETSP0314-20130426/34620_1 /TAXON_ID=38298 /ORGANISM="Rhodella maculata, Strain CCMP 736" /LENGTH=144 /DNA_ID=CAMNT_0027192259 /DNA_START=16 /DNA_END=446 /DNA_ORIENTATION=-